MENTLDVNKKIVELENRIAALEQIHYNQKIAFAALIQKQEVQKKEISERNLLFEEEMKKDRDKLNDTFKDWV